MKKRYYLNASVFYYSDEAGFETLTSAEMISEDFNEYVSVENCMKLSNAVEKYDESFFEDKTLVFVLLSEGSGSVSHKIRSINFNNGVLEVKVKRKVPEIGTCDMAEWTIMFEISKEEASSIKDTKLVLV